MSIFEYDEEEEKRKLREAEYACGKEEGEDILSHLIAVLLEKGDMDSVRRAVKSRRDREALYKKYGILRTAGGTVYPVRGKAIRIAGKP